jgi:hypothetical protein
MAHTTIHVTFIERAAGQILGHSDLPIEQLPASFETSTTLHIGDQDWHIDKAEPTRAEEFGRTGALTLTLSQISYMDPKKILFTLPTLEVAVPQPDGVIIAPDWHTLELHEDDWRQIEFVSVVNEQAIEAELADIGRIYREHSVDNGDFLGFREIHMRERIPTPIDLPLTLEDVQASLGVPGASLDAVSFERMPGAVPESFAFQFGELSVYGTGDATSVHCLCIHRRPSDLRATTLSGVQRLMSTRRLYLVDWAHMIVLAPDDAPSLVRYFSGQ